MQRKNARRLDQKKEIARRSSRFGFEPVTPKKIRAVVHKIVEEFDPVQVILFGSYAYGKPTIDSDVDMLVVMESKERPAVRARQVIGTLRPIKTFPMDVLVRTPSELAHRLAIGDFFMQEIISRGKVLYARRNA